MNPKLRQSVSAPAVTVIALLTLLSLLAAAAAPAASSREAPEVRDDGGGGDAPAPNLDVVAGWVGNETAAQFSLYMQMTSLAPPTDAAKTIHYHFHFQVARTDSTTSLYHAMVHHSASGEWAWMVQRWLPSGGVGSWGETHTTTGFADAATGTVEVQVQKSWVDSPKVDVAKNTWTIDSFYIHADLVRNDNGAIEASDTAPNAGTTGSYAVSVGTPLGAASGQGSPLVLAGLAVAVLVVVGLLMRARPGNGPAR